MTGPARVPRAAEWIAENDTLVSRRGHQIAFPRRRRRGGARQSLSAVRPIGRSAAVE
jgi:hypothetical protein